MNESTKPTIELVYFEGCPHAGEARARLESVLASLGRPREWTEWVQDDEEAPEWTRRLPSPTILVEGESVTGAAAGTQGPACAPGGAPTSEMIRKALRTRERG